MAIAAAAIVILLVFLVGVIVATRPSGSGRPSSLKRPALAGRSGRSSTTTSPRGSATSSGGGTATTPSAGVTSGILTLRTMITGPQGAAEHEIAYSADGSMLVTYGSASSDAMLWNAGTGALITSLPFGPGVMDAAFSPDSQMVAVAERGGGVGLWNVTDHSVTSSLADPSIATGVAFSPDGSTLAVADGSGIRMLDVATRAWGSTLTVPGAAAGLRTVLFTPTGQTLAAADATTGYVYIWHVSTGALIGAVAPPANDSPGLGTPISYSSTTGLLAIGYSGNGSTFAGVRFCSLQSGQVVSTLRYPGVGGVSGIAYDPVDGSILAVVGMNGKVFAWEMPAGTELADPRDPGAAQIADVAFSPDGNTLAVLDANDRIFLWSVTGTS
jgi:WD40 repeat protein